MLAIFSNTHDDAILSNDITIILVNDTLNIECQAVVAIYMQISSKGFIQCDNLNTNRSVIHFRFDNLLLNKTLF